MIRLIVIMTLAVACGGCASRPTAPKQPQEPMRGMPLVHPHGSDRIEVASSSDLQRPWIHNVPEATTSAQSSTGSPSRPTTSSSTPVASEAPSGAASPHAHQSTSQDASDATDAGGSDGSGATPSDAQAGSDAAASPSECPGTEGEGASGESGSSGGSSSGEAQGEAADGQADASGAAAASADGVGGGSSDSDANLIAVTSDQTIQQAAGDDTAAGGGNQSQGVAGGDASEGGGSSGDGDLSGGGESSGGGDAATDINGVVDLATGRRGGRTGQAGDAPAWLTRPGADDGQADVSGPDGQGGGLAGRRTGAASGSGASGSSGGHDGGDASGGQAGDQIGSRKDSGTTEQAGRASDTASASGSQSNQQAQQATGVQSSASEADEPSPSSTVTLGGVELAGNESDQPPGRREIDDAPIAHEAMGREDVQPEPVGAFAAALQGTWRMVVGHDTTTPDFGPAGANHRYIGIDPDSHRLVVMLVWSDGPTVVMTGSFRADFMPDEVDIHLDEDAPSRFPTSDMTLPGGGRLTATDGSESWTLKWSRAGDALRLGDRLYMPVDPAEFTRWQSHQVKEGAALVDPDVIEARSSDEAQPSGDAAPSVDFFGVQSEGRWVCFIVDRSGSMGSDGKIGRLHQELSRSIGGLSPDVSYAVVFFSSGAHVVHEGWTGAKTTQSAALVRKLGQVGASGGTEPSEAFTWAMTMLDPRPDTIFFMTDGQVASDSLPGLLRRLNTGTGRTRIHTIGFGVDADVSLLKRIARDHGGVHSHVQ